MSIRIAINGYGRIGRNILRAHYEGGKKHDLQFVAINDLGNAQTNAHLTRYDTTHGKFPGTIAVEGESMIVNGDRIQVCAKRNPAESTWFSSARGSLRARRRPPRISLRARRKWFSRRRAIRMWIAP